MQQNAPEHTNDIYQTFPQDLRYAFERTFAHQDPLSLAEWEILLRNYRRSL